jgi:sugar lactone lactonase YvrE
MATYTKAVSETASSPSDAVTRTPGPSTSVVSFAAAATPLDVCSDGVGGIWLTCYSGTGVLTFRATDGVLLNTYQWTYMYGLCSGNGYVWSTNHSNGNLYRFTPGTYALSITSPSGYRVDYYPNYDPVSNSVWCSQMGAPANHLQVSASTTTVLSSYNAGSGSYYSGASDGTNWWIPCANETHITVLASNGGTLVNNLTAPHSYPYCCVFDGRYMWVSYSGNAYLTKYDPTTFAVVADYPIISSSGGYICLDNQKNIWLNGLNTVLQYSTP